MKRSTLALMIFSIFFACYFSAAFAAPPTGMEMRPVKRIDAATGAQVKANTGISASQAGNLINSLRCNDHYSVNSIYDNDCMAFTHSNEPSISNAEGMKIIKSSYACEYLKDYPLDEACSNINTCIPPGTAQAAPSPSTCFATIQRDANDYTYSCNAPAGRQILPNQRICIQGYHMFVESQEGAPPGKVKQQNPSTFKCEKDQELRKICIMPGSMEAGTFVKDGVGISCCVFNKTSSNNQ